MKRRRLGKASTFSTRKRIRGSIQVTQVQLQLDILPRGADVGRETLVDTPTMMLVRQHRVSFSTDRSFRSLSLCASAIIRD